MSNEAAVSFSRNVTFCCFKRLELDVVLPDVGERRVMEPARSLGQRVCDL